MEKIFVYIKEHINELLTLIAILISIITAYKQCKLEKKLALIEKRSEIMSSIDKDVVDKLNMNLYFPSCQKEFEKYIEAKHKVDNVKNEIREYLSSLSDVEGISYCNLEYQFKLTEILLEEMRNNSFEKHCNEKELVYDTMLENESFQRDYIRDCIELANKLSVAETNFLKIKDELIKKMANTAKL